MKTPNTHKGRVSASRSRACGTRSTRREGGQPGNRNRQKGIVLPKEPLNLESSESILKFMRTILIPSALTGSLGVRAVTAVTTCCKVLLDYDRLGDLEKRIEELERMKTN